MRGRLKHVVDAKPLELTSWARDRAERSEPLEDVRELSCYDEAREAFGLLKLWLDEVDEGDTQLADDALRAVLDRVGGESLAHQFRLLAGVIFLWEERESGRSRHEMLRLWRSRLDV